MGTVVSFDIRDTDSRAGLDAAVEWLHRVDRLFSTYRPDTQISRLGRGELRLAGCDPEVDEVLALCEHYRTLSDGYFSVVQDGRLDPSAVVKGWAVERASDILREAGSQRHSVNGGGDMQLVGEPEVGQPWRVGIADPLLPGRLVTVVVGSDMAVATSGTAERGHHIINPRTGRPATDLASITIVGRHLTHVDAVATAAFAMGHSAAQWLRGLPDVDAFAVLPDGRQWSTNGFPHDPPGSG